MGRYWPFTLKWLVSWVLKKLSDEILVRQIHEFLKELCEAVNRTKLAQHGVPAHMHRFWYLMIYGGILLFSLDQVKTSLSISFLILKIKVIIILKLLRKPNEIMQSACYMISTQKTFNPSSF